MLRDTQAIGCNRLRWRSLASLRGPARRQQYNQNQAHYVPELPVQSLLLKGLPPPGILNITNQNSNRV